MTKEKIDEIFSKFNTINAKGVLNKGEFVKLYISLRPEPAEQIDEIAEFVFNAFDSDHNGSISFNEFLVI